MTPRRRRAPDRFVLAAGASALAHVAVLAAALTWFGRQPTPSPPPEQGVEVIWDEAAAEAVGEAAEQAPPGAPPSPPAPESVPESAQASEAPAALEVPPLPEAAEQPRPPAPPPLPPPAPRLAEAPPAPAPALDLPPNELPRPELSAIPMAPPVPEMPPSGEPEAAPAPPPEPPPAPPPPQPARSRMARQPPAEASRPGGPSTAPSAAGVGRATGAVAPPSLDPGFRNTAPAYPEASRLRGEQGAVALELSINAQGRVLGAVVARSSGSPALDEAARRAVLEWRFRPAQSNGQAVPGTIRTTVHFRLS